MSKANKYLYASVGLIIVLSCFSFWAGVTAMGLGVCVERYTRATSTVA